MKKMGSLFFAMCATFFSCQNYIPNPQNYQEENEKGKKNALHIALINSEDPDNDDAIFKLIKTVNINERDDISRLPLHYACAKGAVNVVIALIEKGKKNSVNRKDKFGRTPLHDAVRSKNLEIVKLLLEKGADVNIKDKFEKTPLHYAILSQNLEIVKVLIKNKADVNIQDGSGATPLHYAAIKGFWEIITFLYDNGANIYIRDFMQKIPSDYVKQDLISNFPQMDDDTKNKIIMGLRHINLQ